MRFDSAAVALAALLLAACTSAPEPRPFVAPAIVQVPVTRYVPVPDALVEPCPEPALQGRTVGDVVAASNARKLALERCNAQLRAIRRLGRGEPPAP